MHVIATAGHVDHGKSTLIRRLTGIDPDRLPEEKERGLTIDLGFAWLALPGGDEVGIVDVPGHERFIHNMLAGAGPVNATLFVVDATEGWRAQSEEHLQILELLGARTGVVALTKADLVDDTTLHRRADEVRGRLEGTALAGCEIVAVSGTTGAGCDDLLAALRRMLDRLGAEEDRGRPRVYLDRVFTVHGVGTVVTGTLTGGRIRRDDLIQILPSGLNARVRGIQSHRKVREDAEPVSRIAINVAGIERADLHRGDALVHPGQWKPSTEVDVSLRTARGLDHEIRARGAYKLYIGSAEVDVRLTLFGTDALEPGGEAFARLTLAHPIVTAPLDRFVLRDTSRRATVGGGVILDAHPSALRGTDRANRVEQLRIRADASPNEFPSIVVAEHGVVERIDLGWLAGSDVRPKWTMRLRSLEVAEDLYRRTLARIEEALRAFHEANPLVRGMSREDLRSAASVRNQRLFNEIVEATTELLATDGPLVRLTQHTVTLTLEQEGARDVLLEQLADAAFAPPGLQTLIDQHGEPLVRALLEAGMLIKVAEDIAFAASQLDQARETIAAAIEAEGPMTAARLKKLLGTSRKYAIPLLEHLDAIGFTRRRGDLRELAPSGA
ncbi:MAG TPA: selenocysteine-specific translation elongation factor [Actinomycetota bacterium]